MKNTKLLQVEDLTKIFKIGGIVFGSKLTAVDNVNFALEKDENKILTLVGESGSGKTTLGRIILGIIEPTKGRVFYKGEDIFRSGKKQLFRKEIQPVFQNPYESFNPLRKVDAYIMSTALRYHIAKDVDEARSIAEESISLVGLNSDEVFGKYPNELSGGEIQRVAIARSVITKPRILIADEPVSMVDASLRMSILNIFLDLKKKFNMSVIYITHDLSTAYYISDDIAVMYRGNIMEHGDVDQILTDPLHPYTRLLLKSIPQPDPELTVELDFKLPGLEVKEFEALGCKFANRCTDALDVCYKQKPLDVKVGKRIVKCWLYNVIKD